jgi:hypothetical protein
MGTVTHKGWYTSSDEIPQPTSILIGRNLRSNSETPSKPQLEQREQDGTAFQAPPEQE